MGTDHKTPSKKPTAICPHCRQRRQVMPSGKLELHNVYGKWKKSFCRGSGELVRTTKR